MQIKNFTRLLKKVGWIQRQIHHHAVEQSKQLILVYISKLVPTLDSPGLVTGWRCGGRYDKDLHLVLGAARQLPKTTSLSWKARTTCLYFNVLHSFAFNYLLIYIYVLLAASEDEENVTCGSFIKIQQKETGYYLNSEEKQLGSGSGQQIVTFLKDPATHNTLWWVRPAHHGQDAEYPASGSSCHLAEPIECDTVIRLTHITTYRNLHSHAVPSALSRQNEVTAYGTGDGKGDGGDNWKVECVSTTPNKDKKYYWKRGAGIRLRHVDTDKYLGTSAKIEFNQQTCGHNCPIMGHLEAFGRASADSNTLMTVEQGVHLSK